MPPTVTQDLPGVLGTDYRFVRFGGRTYVVYYVNLPNGKRIQMSWKIEENGLRALRRDGCEGSEHLSDPVQGARTLR